MSPTIFSCILCGFPIYDSDTSTTGSWLSQFRAIYSNMCGSFVSGVGCRDDNDNTSWVAPYDASLRWDDERSRSALIDLPVMQQRPIGGQHGFVIHGACWNLLQKAFLTGKIPLKRLLDICESLPFPLPGIGVYWGHDYGKLIIEDQGLYPWEDSLVEDSFQTATHLYAKEDPYNMHDIPTLLPLRTEYSLSWSPSMKSKNCFSKLPWEILENIALLLPTRYALALRHVSTVFLPILYSQTFWASRFKASSDRHFIFEKWEARDTTDWLRLYRLTSLARCSPGLKNRRRIWDLIIPLVKTITLCLAENRNPASEVQGLSSLGWTKVEGALQKETSSGYPRSFYQGCRLFGTHIAHIPGDLSKVGFSFSSVGNINYISGIRLITNKRPDVYLGFISRTNEAILEITTLRGFVLAMGSRGLHALQVVREDANLSQWIGSPSNTPITERLVGFKSIENLEVGFDGFKIVSLGVSPVIWASEVQSPSLRERALWYPSVPRPELCLNEISFTGETPSSNSYLPLFWIHFGGPGGCNLQHVTKVSFDIAKGLYGLELHHDMENESARRYRCKLGRRKNSYSLKKEEFPIDGAGGEIIETIEVTLRRYPQDNVHSFLKHGKLNTIKITTNRKRSFQVGHLSDNDTLVPLTVTPGTTITGFYASQHPEHGIISIGVISEFIDKQPE